MLIYAYVLCVLNVQLWSFRTSPSVNRSPILIHSAGFESTCALTHPAGSDLLRYHSFRFHGDRAPYTSGTACLPRTDHVTAAFLVNPLCGGETCAFLSHLPALRLNVLPCSCNHCTLLIYFRDVKGRNMSLRLHTGVQRTAF